MEQKHREFLVLLLLVFGFLFASLYVSNKLSYQRGFLAGGITCMEVMTK